MAKDKSNSNRTHRAALGLVVLVVLVAHEADELPVALRLGSRVVVSVSGGGSHHLAPGGFELIEKLASGVAGVLWERRVLAC